MSDGKNVYADKVWFENRDSKENKVVYRYQVVKYEIYPGYEQNAKSNSGNDLAIIKCKGKIGKGAYLRGITYSESDSLPSWIWVINII